MLFLTFVRIDVNFSKLNVHNNKSLEFVKTEEQI